MDFLSEFVSSLEERRLVSVEPAGVTDISCPQCGQPLEEIDFNKHFTYRCINWECPLYRVPQGTREKEIVPIPKKVYLSRTLRSGYDRELRKAKQNYEYLCKVGIRAKLAARHKSNKQTKRIRGMIRRGLSPGYINSVLVLRNNDN